MAEVSNGQKLANNTLILYIRSFITLIINLFTSRILLQSLGIDNYGIYDVVGGFVAMFASVTGTLTSTTQRYINFELGKKETGDPKKIFGAAICVHLGLVLIIFVLFESVGLWILNTRLNIPIDRIFASNYVFQLSVFSFILNLLCTPYIAVIVAHEHMKAFAYIGLMDAILKLLISYLLYICPFDQLITYATLLCFVTACDQIIYIYYCKKHFAEARIGIVKDKNLYKSIFKFAGMNSLGSFAAILSNQGVNLILNIFFGVIANAARGIANQVQSAVMRFTSDFMTALNPQITKAYAANNIQYSMELCFKGAKFSFYIMLIFGLPIIIRSSDILHLWLGEYPLYADEFVQLTLLISMIGVLSTPLITEILATGNLTSTTWWIGLTRLLILPFIYIAFVLDAPPLFAYIIILVMDCLLLFIRLIILDSITKMPFLKTFCKDVLKYLFIVVLFCTIGSLILNSLIPDSIIGLLIYLVSSVIYTSIMIFIWGITKSERTAIQKYVIYKLKK